MTTPRCPKSWQVEAVRDGRLTGSAFVLAGKHIADCPDCSREHEALSALSGQLRDLGGNVDELALRRLRQLTLARADSALRGLPAAAQKRRKTIALLGAAALGLALVALRFVRPPTPGIEVVATPSAGAVWTMVQSGDVEYIDLVDGLLSVSVRHSGRAGRLVLRLPDGQLEDVGTKFLVWVSHGHTAEISVAEGAVVFRRRHEPDLELKAGNTWRPTLPPPAAPLPPTAERSPAVGPIPSAAVLPSPQRLGPRGPRRVETAPDRQTEPRASERASEATRSLSDASKEDVAYLHVVALLREHRNEEARLAATAFLRDFPDAFRRKELERMIQSIKAGAGR